MLIELPLRRKLKSDQIQNLLKAGLIKESCSPYSAPVILVLKREGEKITQLCVDFRKLNTITKTGAELEILCSCFMLLFIA